MCRLLGVVSRRPAVLTELLGRDLAAFAELSSIHCDGWGVAGWDADDDLVVHKRADAAHVEPRMTALTDTLVADAAVLHLRKASVGMEVSERNTHPFVAGSVAFAHNGYFGPPDVVDGALAELRGPQPQGDTDSERYFALVTGLMLQEGPVDAILHAADVITSAAQEVVSLNALMLTHQGLYAYSRSAPDAGASSEESGGSSYDLRFRLTVDSVIVASTGWEVPGPTWETLPQGSVLEVRRQDLALTVHHAITP